MSAPLVVASITSWIGHHGAYAVFAIMALDALLPVGGELAMLYAGALSAGAIAGQHPVLLGHDLHTGLESYLVLALAGTIGYLAGALVGWAIGRWGGRSLLERHGRWLHVSAANLDRAEAWFDRHGRSAVFLGRLTPVVRSFISVPAGALDSPLAAYTILTLAGSAIWCFAFAGIGWVVGSNYESFDNGFRYVEIALVAGLLLLAAYVVLRRRRASRLDRRASDPSR